MIGNLYAIGKCVVEENGIYFMPANYNGLFKVDTDNWSLECVCKTSWKVNNMPVDCYKNGDKIYCVSMGNTSIGIYSCEQKTFEFKECSDSKRQNLTSYYEDDKIWIFPFSAEKELLYYDIKKDIYVKCNSWEKWFSANGIKGAFYSTAQQDGKMVFTLPNSKKYITTKYPFLEYTLNELNVEETLQNVFFEGNNICFVAKTKENVFVLKVDGDIIYKNRIKLEPKEDYFVRGISVADILLICCGNSIYKIIKDEAIDLGIPKLESRNEKGSLYMNGINCQNKLILLPHLADACVVFDKLNKSWSCHKFQYESVGWLDTYDWVYEKDAPLEEVLQYVKEYMNNTIKNVNSTYGKTILNKVLDEDLR